MRCLKIFTLKRRRGGGGGGGEIKLVEMFHVMLFLFLSFLFFSDFIREMVVRAPDAEDRLILSFFHSFIPSVCLSLFHCCVVPARRALI